MKLTVKTNLFGEEYVDHVYAWCFKEGNDTDEPVLKYIPKDQCYAVAGQAECEDPDVRPYHKDVYCAKQQNLEKYGKGYFKTKWEIEEDILNTIRRAREEREATSLIDFFN
jgi:hypothetical protein